MKPPFQTFRLIAFLLIISSACSDRPANKYSVGQGTKDSSISDPYSDLPFNDYQFPLAEVYLGKIVTPDLSYHLDSSLLDADKRQWMGLFVNENGYYLRKLVPIMKRDYDPVMDDDHDSSAVLLHSGQRDSCLILMDTFPQLKEGDLNPAFLPKYVFKPGATCHFNYKGLRYTIRNESEVKVISDTEKILYNHRVKIKAEKNGVIMSSMIYAQSTRYDEDISVIFAGDLDRDGLLDLILGISVEEHSYIEALYLSKDAGKGELLKPIAVNQSSGC